MNETTIIPSIGKTFKYRFYCKICGNEIRCNKKHTTTCSDTCRVALSNIMRYSVDPDDGDLTPEEKQLAEKKTLHAKGENVDISDDQRPVHKKIMGGKKKDVAPLPDPKTEVTAPITPPSSPKDPAAAAEEKTPENK